MLADEGGGDVGEHAGGHAAEESSGALKSARVFVVLHFVAGPSQEFHECVGGLLLVGPESCGDSYRPTNVQFAGTTRR